jgi:hypothetical protein
MARNTHKVDKISRRQLLTSAATLGVAPWLLSAFAGVSSAGVIESRGRVSGSDEVALERAIASSEPRRTAPGYGLHNAAQIAGRPQSASRRRT